jgi:hypothetical protein
MDMQMQRLVGTGKTVTQVRGSFRRASLLLAFLAVIVIALPAAAFADGGSFIGPLHTVSVVGSTVPGNGDVNPYGTVLVPESVGSLAQGNVLISNFNDSANLQGTGTTIVQVAPGGQVSTFATIDPTSLPGSCPGGVGLTGALVVLERGWVVVGSLPTTDGTSATTQAGCLLVLDSSGTVVETFAGSAINGPWGLTAADEGDTASLFVSNVLNGTVAANGSVVTMGTIVRLNLGVPEQGGGMPSEISTTVIGSGFSERTDPAALVVGPQGLALAESTLYVADSVKNRIGAIPNAVKRTTSAMTGRTVTMGRFLNAPLGLTVAPNGDILTTNGNNGLMVETTPKGRQIARKLVDRTGTPAGAGCLFDLIPTPNSNGVYFVDDCTNTLDLLH